MKKSLLALAFAAWLVAIVLLALICTPEADKQTNALIAGEVVHEIALIRDVSDPAGNITQDVGVYMVQIREHDQI